MTRTPAHQPRKRFGQNFLHDKGIIEQILLAFDADPGQPIIEIGPGRGALTWPLLERYKALHVIEIDRDLARQLEQDAGAKGQLCLHRTDALKFDFSSIGGARLQLIGNLPYNISTPLIFHLLQQGSCLDLLLLMLQKEVAERICAEPGQSAYGRLSVMVQAQCRVEKLFEVPPGAFYPVPKVTSAVLRLVPEPLKRQQIADYALFENVVRQAFGQRRKTLRNALRGLVCEEDFLALALDASLRAENIPVDSYVSLANLLYKHQFQ